MQCAWLEATGSPQAEPCEKEKHQERNLRITCSGMGLIRSNAYRYKEATSAPRGAGTTGMLLFYIQILFEVYRYTIAMHVPYTGTCTRVQSIPINCDILETDRNHEPLPILVTGWSIRTSRETSTSVLDQCFSHFKKCSSTCNQSPMCFFSN